MSEKGFWTFIAMICIVFGLMIYAMHKSESKPDETHKLASSMVCNESQLLLAKKYLEVCDNSGYFSSHCWDLALINSCGGKK